MENNYKERRNSAEFIIFICIFIAFLIVATIPIDNIFNLKVFSNLNSELASLKISGYSLFSNIVGAPVIKSATGQTGVLNALGSWTINDVSIFLFVVTAFALIINFKKMDKNISNITENVKKVLPIAVTAMLANMVLILGVTTGITVTIVQFIGKLVSGFNISTAALATVIGAFLNSDFFYFLEYVSRPMTLIFNNKDYYAVFGYLTQTLYNASLIFLPTSIGLITGLYYFNIPYNKWLKYIWKVLIAILVIIIAITVILSVLV